MSRREGCNKQAIVLDATAFYAGTPFMGTSNYHVPPRVLKEFSHGNMVGRIEGLVEAGRLIVREPSEVGMARVKQVAASSGDLGQASPADLSVVALAIDLASEGFEVVVLSDDYAVQNLAQIMNVPYVSIISGGIKRAVQWKYYCSGCGKIFGKRVDVCDVCGSRVKRKFRSSTPVSGKAR